MRHARPLLACVLLLVSSVKTSFAQDADANSLDLGDVLISSAENYPAILESFARREAAVGGVIEAQGAFDLVIASETVDRVSGFYSGQVLDTEVRQTLRPLGASFYSGYRLSEGNFPVYENAYETAGGGEARLGLVFSLLRDRSTDERRFSEVDAQLALQQAELDVLLTKIGVQRQAAIAYWRWVSSGFQLRVYERLLSIAEDRQTGLEEQVRRGALAAIFLTENKQNIIRRQRLVIEARREYEAAANELGLFYRGADGAPLPPPDDSLPKVFPLSVDSEAKLLPPLVISEAIRNRPELELLSMALDRIEAEAKLRRNQMLPRLDLKAEVSKDFGVDEIVDPSLGETEAYVGLRFSLPLQRREGRGKLIAAEAKRNATLQKRKLASERIETEIKNILIELDTANELVAMAMSEVEQAETMRLAEEERFANGASDFFLLNIREEAAADARIGMLQAQARAHIARANFDAATVNLPQLGLSSFSTFNGN
ncbi:TolC family protein [Hyphococcus sp.]|jgi:outer membrane protein TolC|uniref:TolC family protein n=1 Tax=Hyphococcus sp. TaxID=2038636 RepID=UPI003D1419FB